MRESSNGLLTGTWPNPTRRDVTCVSSRANAFTCARATYLLHLQHEHEPQRLSALYQYHNAPEVAPAHGLEYDDTIYPSSDKYPVIRETAYDGKHGGEYGFGGDNRPPRIIFGMKVKTFLMVASVMILVIVGAAVGGAVGGQQLREDQSQAQSL